MGTAETNEGSEEEKKYKIKQQQNNTHTAKT